jgi:hypothetical protein
MISLFSFIVSFSSRLYARLSPRVDLRILIARSICPQELQRRLDQTLGKPGSYLAGIDRAGNVKPMTIGARLYRLEQQVRLSL